MVDVEETEDVYLAIEKGLKLLSIFQLSYSTLRYYLTKFEDPKIHTGKINFNDIPVCSRLSDMVDAGNSPDILLDTTSTGLFSNAVKSLTNSLGIPTISMSYGEPESLR